MSTTDSFVNSCTCRAMRGTRWPYQNGPLRSHGRVDTVDRSRSWSRRRGDGCRGFRRHRRIGKKFVARVDGSVKT